MSDIQYSVEFHAVKFTKYKSGAPKDLLEKGGRWQKAGIYGGFDNIDYEPCILTNNKAMYEAAPDMYELIIEFKSFAERQGWDHVLINDAEKLLAKARGEK